MRASGLDYESLRAVKPDIILASATAYGEGGPYSDRIGFDGTGQVMSGAVVPPGPARPPIRTVVPYADFGTALTMAHRRDDGAVPPAGDRRGPARGGRAAARPR